jgi:hypothetical protein
VVVYRGRVDDQGPRGQGATNNEQWINEQ